MSSKKCNLATSQSTVLSFNLPKNFLRFGYSNKLNKQDSDEAGSTDSGTLTPEEQRKELEKRKFEGEIIDELAVQNVDFAQSGKSLKLNAKNLQKLAANFGTASEETDDEELSDDREEANGKNVEDGGEELTDDSQADEEVVEVVFPIVSEKIRI